MDMASDSSGALGSPNLSGDSELETEFHFVNEETTKEDEQTTTRDRSASQEANIVPTLIGADQSASEPAVDSKDLTKLMDELSESKKPLDFLQYSHADCCFVRDKRTAVDRFMGIRVAFFGSRECFVSEDFFRNKRRSRSDPGLFSKKLDDFGEVLMTVDVEREDAGLVFVAFFR